MGELKSLSDLRGFFQARSLDKGTDVLLLWRQEGALEVGVRPPGTPPDYQKVCALQAEQHRHVNVKPRSSSAWVLLLRKDPRKGKGKWGGGGGERGGRGALKWCRWYR